MNTASVLRGAARGAAPALVGALAGTLVGALAPCLAPRDARAQGPQGAPAGPVPYQQTLSVSPILFPFGIFSAEYERKIGVPGLTFGASGTYTTTTQLYPRRDRWIEGRVLFYPGGRPLEGFGVGVMAGAHRAERKFREDPVVLQHDGGATLGAIATYTYFYGPRRRFFVRPGVGYNRVLKNVAVNSPLSQNFFELQATLGIAF